MTLIRHSISRRRSETGLARRASSDRCVGAVRAKTSIARFHSIKPRPCGEWRLHRSNKTADDQSFSTVMRWRWSSSKPIIMAK